MKSRSLLPITALFFLGTAPAFAYDVGDFFGPVPAQVQKANTGLYLSIGRLDQHYAEHPTNGMPPDTERGTVPAVSFGLVSQGTHFGWGLAIRLAKGSDHYSGVLQTGSGGDVVYTPSSGSTQNLMIDPGFTVDEGFSPVRHLALRPELFFGEHIWLRQLQGRGGYKEIYAHLYYGAGLKADYALPHGIVFSLGYQVGKMRGATMEADLGAYGLGSPVLALGNHLERRYDARLTWAIPHHRTSLYVDDALTRFSYGASQTTANGVFEPASTTRQNTVSVGVITLF